MRSRIFEPRFETSEEEIEYLRKKVDFLSKHAQSLADWEHRVGELAAEQKLGELEAMKQTWSWGITKPLRDARRSARAIRSWWRARRG